ncbi:MAG: LysR family transcriptional regulator [Pseudomonadota bacterium]
MRSQDLNVFIKIAEIGSIQAAADVIGLTQSAASRVIQRLEEQLGASLFDRTSKPLALTRDGELALRHARKILSATDDFIDAFDNAGTPSGTFRIGLAHAIAPLVLRGSSLHAMPDFPKVSLIYRADWTGPLIDRVRNNDLDLAWIIMSAGEVAPSDLRAKPIVNSLVSAVGHPSLARLDGDLTKLNEIGWALNPEGCGYRRQLSAALHRSGNPVNIRVEVNTLELQLQIAQSRQALTLVPSALVGSILERYDLVTLPLPDLNFGVTVTEIQPKQETRLAPVAALVSTNMQQIIT